VEMPRLGRENKRNDLVQLSECFCDVAQTGPAARLPAASTAHTEQAACCASTRYCGSPCIRRIRRRPPHKTAARAIISLVLVAPLAPTAAGQVSLQPTHHRHTRSALVVYAGVASMLPVIAVNPTSVTMSCHLSLPPLSSFFLPGRLDVS
jgi:hypothetical protein